MRMQQSVQVVKMLDDEKELDARHPIGHIGEPDDIAYGVLYLVSDEAKFVT